MYLFRYTKNRNLTRGLCLLTMLAFLSTSSQIQPSYAADLSTRPGQSGFGQIPLTEFVRDPAVSPRIGVVEDSFIANEGSHALIVLRDPHGMGSSQLSIDRLIVDLRQRYDFSFVGIEGAAGNLDALALSEYPDKEAMVKRLEELALSGELSGGVISAVKLRNELFFFGLENQKLYERGINLYLAAIQDTSLRETVHHVTEKFNVLRDQILHQNTREIMALKQQYDAGILGLADWIKALHASGAVSAETLQEQFPHVAAVLKYMTLIESHDSNALKDEVGEAALKAEGVVEGEEKIQFYETLQNYRTERISAPIFALYLRNVLTRHKLQVSFSASLNKLMETESTLEAFRVPAVLSEFRGFETEALKALFDGPRETALLKIYGHLHELEHISKLQLSREEWESLQRAYARMNSRPGLESNFEGASDINALYSETETVLKALFSSDNPFKAFYVNAARRETAFIGALSDSVSRLGSGVVLSGGFHTEALLRYCRDNNISYAVISPVGVPGEKSHYENVMKGDISWKRFAESRGGRVNIEKAFVLSLIESLTDKEEWHDALLLKNWRDRIIRRLAEEGRLGEAYRYTRRLDEYGSRKRPGNLFVSPEDNWRGTVRRFVDAMKELDSRGSLTPESLAPLTAYSGVMAWGSAQVLQENASAPVVWLSGLAEDAYRSDLREADGGSRSEGSRFQPVFSEDHPVLGDYSAIRYPNAGLRGEPPVEAETTLIDLEDFEFDVSVWRQRSSEGFTEEEESFFSSGANLTPLTEVMKQVKGSIKKVRQSTYDRTDGQIQVKLAIEDTAGEIFYSLILGSNTNEMAPLKELMPELREMRNQATVLLGSAGNQGDLPGNFLILGNVNRWRYFAGSDEAWHGIDNPSKVLVETNYGRRMLGTLYFEGDKEKNIVEKVIFKPEGEGMGMVLRPEWVRFILSANLLAWGDVPADELAREYYTRDSDLRHLFAFPYFEGEPLFYEQVSGSQTVWDMAMNHKALRLRLETRLGKQVALEKLKPSLDKYGYRQVGSDIVPEIPGDYRVSDNEITLVLLPAVYPVNLLAVSEDGAHAGILTVTGDSGRKGAHYLQVGTWARDQIRKKYGWEPFALFALDNGRDPSWTYFDESGAARELVVGGRNRYNAAMLVRSRVDLSGQSSELDSIMRETIFEDGIRKKALTLLISGVLIYMLPFLTSGLNGSLPIIVHLVGVGLFYYGFSIFRNFREQKRRSFKRWEPAFVAMRAELVNRLYFKVMAERPVIRAFLNEWEQPVLPHERIRALLDYINALTRLDKYEFSSDNPLEPGDTLDYIRWRRTFADQNDASLKAAATILRSLVQNGVLNEYDGLRIAHVDQFLQHLLRLPGRLDILERNKLLEMEKRADRKRGFFRSDMRKPAYGLMDPLQARQFAAYQKALEEAIRNEPALNEELVKAGYRLEDYESVIYPAAGNYDAGLIVMLAQNVFPRLKQVYLNSLSYQYGTGQDAAKSVKLHIERQFPKERLDQLEVVTDAGNYYGWHPDVPDQGRRIWIDKGPGRNAAMRSNPAFYATAVKNGMVRAGDLVLMVPYPGTTQYAPWKRMVAEGLRVPGYTAFDNWRVYEVIEEDIEELSKVQETPEAARSDLRESFFDDYSEIRGGLNSILAEISRTMESGNPAEFAEVQKDLRFAFALEHLDPGEEDGYKALHAIRQSIMNLIARGTQTPKNPLWDYVLDLLGLKDSMIHGSDLSNAVDYDENRPAKDNYTANFDFGESGYPADLASLLIWLTTLKNDHRLYRALAALFELTNDEDSALRNPVVVRALRKAGEDAGYIYVDRSRKIRATARYYHSAFRAMDSAFSELISSDPYTQIHAAGVFRLLAEIGFQESSEEFVSMANGAVPSSAGWITPASLEAVAKVAGRRSDLRSQGEKAAAEHKILELLASSNNGPEILGIIAEFFNSPYPSVRSYAHYLHQLLSRNPDLPTQASMREMVNELSLLLQSRELVVLPEPLRGDINELSVAEFESLKRHIGSAIEDFVVGGQMAMLTASEFYRVLQITEKAGITVSPEIFRPEYVYQFIEGARATLEREGLDGEGLNLDEKLMNIDRSISDISEQLNASFSKRTLSGAAYSLVMRDIVGNWLTAMRFMLEAANTSRNTKKIEAELSNLKDNMDVIERILRRYPVADFWRFYGSSQGMDIAAFRAAEEAAEAVQIIKNMELLARVEDFSVLAGYAGAFLTHENPAVRSHAAYLLSHGNDTREGSKVSAEAEERAVTRSATRRLDASFRFTIPADWTRWREGLAEGAVLFPSPDGRSLEIYQPDDWFTKVEQGAPRDARDLRLYDRLMYGNTFRVPLDSGRIAIPSQARDKLLFIGGTPITLEDHGSHIVARFVLPERGTFFPDAWLRGIEEVMGFEALSVETDLSEPFGVKTIALLENKQDVIMRADFEISDAAPLSLKVVDLNYPEDGDSRFGVLLVAALLSHYPEARELIIAGKLNTRYPVLGENLTKYGVIEEPESFTGQVNAAVGALDPDTETSSVEFIKSFILGETQQIPKRLLRSDLRSQSEKLNSYLRGPLLTEDAIETAGESLNMIARKYSKDPAFTQITGDDLAAHLTNHTILSLSEENLQTVARALHEVLSLSSLRDENDLVFKAFSVAHKYYYERASKSRGRRSRMSGYEESLRILQALRIFTPGRAQVDFRYAFLLSHAGRRLEAESVFEQLLSERKGNRSDRVNLAYTKIEIVRNLYFRPFKQALKKGSYAEASEYFNLARTKLSEAIKLLQEIAAPYKRRRARVGDTDADEEQMTRVFYQNASADSLLASFYVAADEAGSYLQTENFAYLALVYAVRALDNATEAMRMPKRTDSSSKHAERLFTETLSTAERALNRVFHRVVKGSEIQLIEKELDRVRSILTEKNDYTVEAGQMQNRISEVRELESLMRSKIDAYKEAENFILRGIKGSLENDYPDLDAVKRQASDYLYRQVDGLTSEDADQAVGDYFEYRDVRLSDIAMMRANILKGEENPDFEEFWEWYLIESDRLRQLGHDVEDSRLSLELRLRSGSLDYAGIIAELPPEADSKVDLPVVDVDFQPYSMRDIGDYMNSDSAWVKKYSRIFEAVGPWLKSDDFRRLKQLYDDYLTGMERFVQLGQEIKAQSEAKALDKRQRLALLEQIKRVRVGHDGRGGYQSSRHEFEARVKKHRDKVEKQIREKRQQISTLARQVDSDAALYGFSWLQTYRDELTKIDEQLQLLLTSKIQSSAFLSRDSFNSLSGGMAAIEGSLRVLIYDKRETLDPILRQLREREVQIEEELSDAMPERLRGEIMETFDELRERFDNLVLTAGFDLGTEEFSSLTLQLTSLGQSIQKVSALIKRTHELEIQNHRVHTMLTTNRGAVAPRHLGAFRFDVDSAEIEGEMENLLSMDLGIINEVKETPVSLEDTEAYENRLSDAEDEHMRIVALLVESLLSIKAVKAGIISYELNKIQNFYKDLFQWLEDDILKDSVVASETAGKLRNSMIKVQEFFTAFDEALIGNNGTIEQASLLNSMGFAVADFNRTLRYFRLIEAATLQMSFTNVSINILRSSWRGKLAALPYLSKDAANLGVRYLFDESANPVNVELVILGKDHNVDAAATEDFRKFLATNAEDKDIQRMISRVDAQLDDLRPQLGRWSTFQELGFIPLRQVTETFRRATFLYLQLFVNNDSVPIVDASTALDEGLLTLWDEWEEIYGEAETVSEKYEYLEDLGKLGVGENTPEHLKKARETVRNILEEDPQDLTPKWDAEVLERVRDFYLTNWAKNREDPEAVNIVAQGTPTDMFETEKKPKKRRSDLRLAEPGGVIEEVARSIVDHESLSAKSARELLSLIQSQGYESVTDKILSAGFETGLYMVLDPFLSGLTQEQKVRSLRPNFDGDNQRYTQAAVELFLSELSRRLESGETGINLSFVYRMPEGQVTRAQLSRYFSEVSRLKMLFPRQIEADFLLIAGPGQLEGEGAADFLRKISATGIVKSADTQSPGSGVQIKRFLDKNGNALIYGLDVLPPELSHTNRAVQTALSSDEIFPVVLALTDYMSSSSSRVSAELLREIPHDFPGLFDIVGGRLVLKNTALEIAYMLEVRQLFGRMA